MGRIIVAYNGLKKDIPLRWSLCDGSNGTPDLTNRFIEGAANFSEIGVQGEMQPHSHTVENSSSHTHTKTNEAGSHRHLPSGSGNFRVPEKQVASESHSHSITGSAPGHIHEASTVEVLPKYYVLCYIAGDEGDGFDFPKKSIVMYSGTEEDLPEGWTFCDGNNGTIDLRNRFIKGATTRGGIGGSQRHTHGIAEGGSHTHTTTSASNSHKHDISSDQNDRYEFWFNRGSGSGFDYGGGSHTHRSDESGSHTHGVSSADNQVPSYKLAYIQRGL